MFSFSDLLFTTLFAWFGVPFIFMKSLIVHLTPDSIVRDNLSLLQILSYIVSSLPLDSFEPLAELLERFSDRHELLLLGGWLAVSAQQALEQTGQRYLYGTLVIVVGARSILQEAQQRFLLCLTLCLLRLPLLLLEFLSCTNDYDKHTETQSLFAMCFIFLTK